MHGLLLGILLVLTQNIICRNLQETSPIKPNGEHIPVPAKIENTTRQDEVVSTKRGDNAGVTDVKRSTDARLEIMLGSRNLTQNKINGNQTLFLGILPLFLRARETSNVTSKPAGSPLNASDVSNKLSTIFEIISQRQKHGVWELYNNMKEKMKETGAKIANKTASILPNLKSKRGFVPDNETKASNISDLPSTIDFRNAHDVIRSIFDKINYLRAMRENGTKENISEPKGEKVKNETVALNRSKTENKTEGIMIKRSGNLEALEHLLFLRKPQREAQKNMQNENLRDREIFAKKPFLQMKNMVIRPKFHDLVRKRKGLQEVAAVGFEIQYQDCDKNKVFQNKVKNLLTEDSIIEHIFKTIKKMLKFITNLNDPFIGSTNQASKSSEKMEVFDIFNISKYSGKWNMSKEEGHQNPGEKTYQEHFNETHPHVTGK
ncbi:hypothetical protein C0J52_09113 [Blattella germanica]|nr:hypothetical protein C0J52_09113 [Blattella germanica]